MKKQLLICIFFILFTKIIAQPDFRKGFVVKNNGDTLRGAINFQSDSKLSEQCIFSAKGLRDNLSFKPEEIKSYTIYGEKYYLTKTLGEKKYFLEVLVEGKLNLYFFPMKNQEKFYIEKENMPLKEIYYRDSIINLNGKQYQERTQNHLAILNQYSRDADNFEKEILEVRTLNESNLVHFAKKYHQTICKDYDCVEYKRKSLINVGIEPFAGVTSIAQFVASSNPFYYAQKSFFTKGVFINFWAGRRNERFFFRTGYYETTIKYNDGFTDKARSIPFQVGYIFPKSYKIRPTLSIDLLRPNYTGGVQFHVFKRLNLGIYGNMEFVSAKPPFRIIPKKLFTSSLFGSIAVNF